MELRFFGATGETTGSCHLIRHGRHDVLLDCGLFQGRREESYRKNARCAFDPRRITAVVQSHAHIDHSGKLPMLVRLGFRGRIHATSATADLCGILLRDCAHIMLQDAEFLNRQRMRKKLWLGRHGSRGKHLRRALEHALERERDPARPGDTEEAGVHRSSSDRWAAIATADLPAREVLPLYLLEDVSDTLPLFVTHEYHEWFEAAPGMRFRFRDAGHILGSAWIEAEIGVGTAVERLVFTGDYGRAHQPILRDPEPLSEADVYISESTYGGRTHPPLKETDDELAAAVRRLAERGRGRLLIPAFAVGRTQNILYSLAQLYRRRAVPPVDIVVDSPLATAATRITLRHPECFDEAALREVEAAETDPLFRSHLRFVETVEESKALNEDPRPLIVISASGMMETGRILHHLAHHVATPQTEILIVGFQAQHTLGRRLLDGANRVQVFGIGRDVRARVTPMLGFSAHADQGELVAALAPHAERARAVFLVHGEDRERHPLGRSLAGRGFRRVEMPSGAELYRA